MQSEAGVGVHTVKVLETITIDRIRRQPVPSWLAAPGSQGASRGAEAPRRRPNTRAPASHVTPRLRPVLSPVLRASSLH